MARSAAWRSRAPCAPGLNCSASTSRPPASIRKELLALNALLNDIKDTTGTSILLIEHDMSVVMQISDHVVVLEYGRKISDGDPTFGEERSARHRRLSRRRRRGGDDVLAEVGDEQVIEQLDAEPDSRAWTRRLGLDAGRSGERHGRHTATRRTVRALQSTGLRGKGRSQASPPHRLPERDAPATSRRASRLRNPPNGAGGKGKVRHDNGSDSPDAPRLRSLPRGSQPRLRQASAEDR